MNKRQLGTTGKTVTAIGLGGMPLSLSGRPEESQAEMVIRRFIEGGGDFIDTANVYCMGSHDLGHNERLIGNILRRLGRQDTVLVGTKGGLTKEGSGWDVKGTPVWLRQSCERSLADLGVERIFLYQLHAPDPSVPFADSIGELARLRDAGKIEHVGLSNVDVSQISAAQQIVPIISVQNKCHVFMKQSFQNGVVEHCASNQITFLAHSPVGGHGRQQRLGESKPLLELSRQAGATPWQLALAWLLHKGDQIIPIPGASRPESIAASLQAIDVQMSAEQIASLDQLRDW